MFPPLRSQTLVTHTPSSFCLMVHVCCLTNSSPEFSYTLCQPHLFLPSSLQNLRQKTALKKIIRSWFLKQRRKQQVPHEQVMLCPTKSKGNPDIVRLKWSKCRFAQLLQPREDMGLIHSSQPSSAVTDAAWNWRRNDDAGPFPSRCRSVTMEADSVLSTSLSAK